MSAHANAPMSAFRRARETGPATAGRFPLTMLMDWTVVLTLIVLVLVGGLR